MKNYLHILTVTAFLLGIIAPACGFSWGGKLNVIEICTEKGIETRIVANNEQEDKAPTPMIGDECQFCFTNTNLTSFLPTSIEKRYAYTTKLSYSLYEVILLSRTPLNRQPRAPPSKTFI